MEKFEVNEYLIITEIDQVIALEDMGFKQNYPYRVVDVTRDDTAVIKNHKHTFIFTPNEMKSVRKATKQEVKRAYAKYYDGDLIVVHNKEQFYMSIDLDLTNGNTYAVENVDRVGLPAIVDDKGGTFRFLQEDLIHIEKVYTEDDTKEQYISNLFKELEIGDNIVILNISKVHDAKSSSFFYNVPYEITAIIKEFEAIVITNKHDNELMIAGDELRYIRPHVDVSLQRDIDNFIKKLETSNIKRNMNTMIDVALQEKRYDRLKEIVEMGISFN